MLSPIFLCVAMVIPSVMPHGSMHEPPARASLWRVDPRAPTNYYDIGLNCGGFGFLQTVGGKCGVCGDPYGGPYRNQAGGKYATGIITRTYNEGQIINTLINLTANHGGYMEFRICPNNDVTRAVTHACLDAHVLQLADGSGTRLPIHFSDGTGLRHIRLQLPDGMTCSQCVLQWKMHNNNSPGYAIQEEFYACADVAIRSSTSGFQTAQTALPSTLGILTTQAHLPLQTTQSKPVVCRAINLWAGDPNLDRYCQSVCTSGVCPHNGCECV